MYSVIRPSLIEFYKIRLIRKYLEIMKSVGVLQGKWKLCRLFMRIPMNTAWAKLDTHLPKSCGITANVLYVCQK